MPSGCSKYPISREFIHKQEKEKKQDKRLGIQRHEEVLLTGMFWYKPVHDFGRDAR